MESISLGRRASSAGVRTGGALKRACSHLLAWLWLGGLWLAACAPGPPPQAASPPTAAPTAAPTATALGPTPAVSIPPFAPAAAAAAPSIFGLELAQLTERGGLPQARAAGAAWLRRPGVWWPSVEPREGERRWDALAGLEAELLDAASQGFSVILVVRGTPDWAQSVPGQACSPIRQEKFNSFANFLYDLAARYSQPPYSVKYWEIWNEPDIAPQLVAPDSAWGCWGDLEDPYYGGEYFGEMLKAVYPSIKTADPGASVIVGGLLLDCDPRRPPEGKDCSPARFLDGILQSGATPFFDGVSFHAYDYYLGELGQYANPNWHSAWDTSGPAGVAKAQFLREVLTSYGAGHKWLVNTEAALLCGRSGEEPECLSLAFQTTKAYYLAQSFTTALAAGLKANIWYSLMGWRASGLVNTDLSPQPAYLAYQALAGTLGEAAFRREITEYPGIRGFEFARGERAVWVLWSADGGQHALALPRQAESIRDVYGNARPLALAVDVGLELVIVEWTDLNSSAGLPSP